MNPGDILSTWKGLVRTPGAALSGVRARGLSQGTMAWLASDAQQQPYLLVQVDAGAEGVHWRTQGLHVWIDRFSVGESAESYYLAVRCSDGGFLETFSLVVSDILLRLGKSPDNAVDTVLNTLERWKIFWRVPHQGLGREAELGLFGELWFLFRWLGERLPAGVSGWQGPKRSRHDFQFSTCSFEVKAASGTVSTGPVHKIHGLEQLDNPEKGQLFLFSLHVVEDPLANNGLVAIIEQIENFLGAEIAILDSFRTKLASMGYSPGHNERYRQKFRIISEGLYVVADDFPRLTRTSFPRGLPAGISDVSYSLGMTHCARWKHSSVPTDPGFLNIVRDLK